VQVAIGQAPTSHGLVTEVTLPHAVKLRSDLVRRSHRHDARIVGVGTSGAARLSVGCNSPTTVARSAAIGPE
jgi:hypothetical protein